MVFENLPLSNPFGRMGRLQNRDKSEDLPDKTLRSSFREEKRRIIL
jgi:hypothetical protein